MAKQGHPDVLPGRALRVADDDRGGRGSFTSVELSQARGAPARTICFNVAGESLPPPLVRGRSACYGEGHLKVVAHARPLTGTQRP